MEQNNLSNLAEIYANYEIRKLSDDLFEFRCKKCGEVFVTTRRQFEIGFRCRCSGFRTFSEIAKTYFPKSSWLRRKRKTNKEVHWTWTFLALQKETNYEKQKY